jgi:hypothetical protein
VRAVEPLRGISLRENGESISPSHLVELVSKGIQQLRLAHHDLLEPRRLRSRRARRRAALARGAARGQQRLVGVQQLALLAREGGGGGRRGGVFWLQRLLELRGREERGRGAQGQRGDRAAPLLAAGPVCAAPQALLSHAIAPRAVPAPAPRGG